MLGSYSCSLRAKSSISNAQTLPSLARVEQRIEHRVAVEARQAAPDDAAALVDQRAVGAVADHAQVQGGLAAGCMAAAFMRSPCRPFGGRRRLCSSSAQRGAAIGAGGARPRSAPSPTFTPRPPQPLHGGEADFVGEVVAHEHRHAAGKRRLVQEGLDRVALAGAAGLGLDHHLAAQQGQARRLFAPPPAWSARHSASSSGACR